MDKDYILFKKIIIAVTIVTSILLIGRILKEYEEKDLPYTKQIPVFDTYAKITFYKKNEQNHEIATEIFKLLRHLHKIANIYDNKSEISHLNQTASQKPFKCSETLWKIILAAQNAYKHTNGYFDISCTPIMKLWGFHRKRKTLPSEKEKKEVLKFIGFDKIILDKEKHTVFFSVKGMSLDMGGLVKGYALQEALKILKKYNITYAMLDFGGNIACPKTPPPGKDTFTIGIKHPIDQTRLLTQIPLLNRTISTSGNYERYVTIDNKQYSHIMNPINATPIQNAISVSVLTPSSINSDILSTAIFAGAPNLIIDNFPDTDILIIKMNDKKLSYRTIGKIWGKIEL
ncbi:MAG: FAD:protein FMN transferase [Verrucomicrobiota bacterium]|nr:FAD:protein FMN transferase [Verrucomicrobiota bacterium]